MLKIYHIVVISLLSSLMIIVLTLLHIQLITIVSIICPTNSVPRFYIKNFTDLIDSLPKPVCGAATAKTANKNKNGTWPEISRNVSI